MFRGRGKRLIFTVISVTKVLNRIITIFGCYFTFYFDFFKFIVRVLHDFFNFEEMEMEDWDQQTLEKIVESKKTEYKQNKPTDIVSGLYNVLSTVCKYFVCGRLVLHIFLSIVGAQSHTFLLIIGHIGDW